jgi:hypothetical protein
VHVAEPGVDWGRVCYCAPTLSPGNPSS